MYVQECAMLCRITIMVINNQYLNDFPFNCQEFSRWKKIIDLSCVDNYLQFNNQGRLYKFAFGN